MIKYLCSPRISWLVLVGLVFGLEIIRQYPEQPTMMAGGAAFILVAILVDYLVVSHAQGLRLREEERARQRREFDIQDAEKDPNILERLRNLSETVYANDQELEDLRVELKIAIAERQKAEEEREDIRKILDYNRTGWRAEQLESQSLRERVEALSKAGVQ